ncbi:Calx-beta domain-containing protein [Ancylobacter defluvii]|uniref:cellulase n=1 Tax=Ancylobacter defluvii TaxID=1282440 RepID=A0A9W6NB60_9HYPH|nr:Calx-beta domain-containing protein [Ancylobacter defluvii]MBS7585818.1 cellulase family glycosylhydrolase [Ancylobacter defluvii]GLK84191.1 hypothetical protein GCM10017653_22610 [Ancylobacter defluvii]
MAGISPSETERLVTHAAAPGIAAAGRILSADLPTSGTQRIIQDFDPTRDKLDLGANSVHAFIVVDTPEGVAFRDPWSGREVLIAGISLGQLTVDSFVPVENDHLRQDLSGALAWEHGIQAAPHTVYARSHEIGQIDRVAFDPQTDTIYGTREQIFMVDSAEGVVIGNYTTGQALILLNAKVAELSIDNFVFHNAQAKEDCLWLQLGFTAIPESQIRSRADIPTAGTNAWPTEAGPGDPPSGEAGTTFLIDWDHSSHVVLDFDPATDRLDFNYFRPNGFTVAEAGGSVVIAIVGQNQSYTLDGVALAELDYNNIVAVEDATYQTWLALIDEARNDAPQAAIPVLSVADAQVTEGQSGAGMLMFTVSLSAAAAGVVTVDYATLNGTAQAGSDYQAALGTLTFQPGETSKMVHVAINGDTTFESDETFQLVLSSPAGAALGDGSAAGTIRNDDATPAGRPLIRVGDVTVAEGDDGEPHMMFPITLSFASDTPVSVRYLTRDDAAKAGSDYEAMSGTVTFAPGQTVAHVHVPLIGNRTVEADERFYLLLGHANGGTIVDGIGQGFITNDDAVTPPPSGSGDEVIFTVTDDWTSGFTGAMTLMPEDTLNGWTVEFDAPFAIGNIWNAEIVSHVGDHYVVRNASWNGKVAADGAVTFGFQAAPGGASTAATGFIVNGVSTGEPKPEPELPMLAVADTQVSEGDSGMAHLTFTVSLSEASTSAVTVRYATANASATAGSDYSPLSGSLTFAPGEFTKTIHVMVNGDTLVEANETLALTLSDATGATIADARATGTIRNDDVAAPVPKPVVSVSNVSVTEGDPGTGSAADGWFSTSGNQIVDSAGNPVKIAGVNWFGFESTNASPHGVWTRGYQDMMDQMKDLGFNTVRLPFSTDTLHASSAAGIDYGQNPEFQGLTPLQIMDKVVEYAGDIGLKVILDHHRSGFGAGASENGLWYDSAHPESQWIADWQMLAERYADDPTVIGADLHNEPHAGTWGGGGANDWAAAAERAGNAIGAVNDNWLIFVEGVGSYQGENYWWGGNLMGVRDRPIELDVPNKLVYSPHDYGNSVYAQPWFQGSDFAADLPAKFDEMWGYIYREGIAPVYIGEFGTRLQDPKDAPWLEALTSYMSGDFDNDGALDIPADEEGMSWTYWSWNPNSTDTGGILKDDWRTVHTDKLAYLEPIQFDFDDGVSTDATYAVFMVALSEASTEAVTVGFHTMAGSADASDFTAVSGTLTFQPGETSKLIRVPVTPETQGEPDEQFTLMLTDADGAVIGVAEGVATIVDDDKAVPIMPSLSIADARVEEGHAGQSGQLAFTVTLSAPATETVTVGYRTVDGTAVAGQDYTPTTGSLTIAAGQTTATIHVPIIGENAVETDERLTVVLTNAVGATLGDAQAIGTLVNDDAAVPPPSGGGDELVYTVTDDWTSGFTGAMTLNADDALNGWVVEFEAPFDITNIWNAEIVSHVGDHYVIRNASWNGKVAADGQVSFGFQASPGGASTTASDFVVNGEPVGGSEPLARMVALAEPADDEASLESGAGLLFDDVLTPMLSDVTTSEDGFNVEVTIHNDGDAAKGWTVEIGTPFEITEVSNAEIIARTEDGYIIGGIGESSAVGGKDDITFEIAGHGVFTASQFDLLI